MPRKKVLPDYGLKAYDWREVFCEKRCRELAEHFGFRQGFDLYFELNEMALCLGRLIPPLKARDTPVRLDGVEGKTLNDQGAAIVTAMGAGQVTPDHVAKLLQAVAAQARVLEVAELQKRVEGLELTLKHRRQP